MSPWATASLFTAAHSAAAYWLGMGAIIMDGVVVEEDVMIAAGALVTPGKHLESGWVYAGSPAKPLRKLSDAERRFLSYSATNYVRLKDRYLSQKR